LLAKAVFSGWFFISHEVVPEFLKFIYIDVVVYITGFA